MTASRFSLSRLLCAAVLCLGLTGLLVPTSVSAQTAAGAPISASPDLADSDLTEHLAAALRSENRLRQHQALKDIITLGATCPSQCMVSLLSKSNARVRYDEASRQHVVDFAALAPTILERYHRFDAEGDKLLALAALYSAGDEPTLIRLGYAVNASKHETVRRAAARYVATYFTERYPPLRGIIAAHGGFSMYDVALVRAKGRASASIQ
jgi:hypothetical protein